MTDPREQRWKVSSMTQDSGGVAYGIEVSDPYEIIVGKSFCMEESVATRIVSDHNFHLDNAAFVGMKEEIECMLIDCRRHPRIISDAAIENLIERINEVTP